MITSERYKEILHIIDSDITASTRFMNGWSDYSNKELFKEIHDELIERVKDENLLSYIIDIVESNAIHEYYDFESLKADYKKYIDDTDDYINEMNLLTGLYIYCKEYNIK
nr:MAG TPA: hypothetical protein [Caudoviricetes sp.]